jgi:hypothetical protein
MSLLESIVIFFVFLVYSVFLAGNCRLVERTHQHGAVWVARVVFLLVGCSLEGRSLAFYRGIIQI